MPHHPPTTRQNPPHIPPGKSPVQNRIAPIQNRISDVLIHIPWYSIDGITRLAQDAGVSKSALCRLIAGQSSPSFSLVWKVTKALEKRLGKRLEPRDLLTLDGTYPTPSVCTLTGCTGCLPDAFYNEDGSIKREFAHVKSGEWGISPKSGLPEEAA